MKHFLFAVLILCAVIAAPVYADQTRCRTFDTYNADGPGNNERRLAACGTYCRSRGGDLDGYLANGWSVESQRPVTLMEKPFKANQVDVPDEGFCRCIGAEYILRK